MNGLRKRYDALTSRQRMALLTALALFTIGIAGLMMWSSRSSTRADEAATGKIGSVAMTSDLLEDTLTERVEQRVESLESQNAELVDLVNALVDTTNRERVDSEKKLERIEADARSKLAEIEAAASAAAGEEGGPNPQADPHNLDLSPKNELADIGAYQVADSYPAPPQLVTPAPPAGFAAADFEPPEPKILGAIAAMPDVGFEAPQKKSEAAGETIFLPPGFMNARLLTGVDALVSQNAQGNPEPIIARVQAPAVLPNHVRANLQGCFVVGNATGSLAKERVEVRAVSLSCIDYQERAVIDEPIKGFFVDTDGKKGLSGRVVTRAGALLARSFVAGVLSGFGEAVQATSGTRAVSPLGEVRSFSPGDVAAAGAAGGVSQASEDLSELYLELARQAGPVVEVGAGKDVVLVIQEGVNLNLRRGVNVVQ